MPVTDTTATPITAGPAGDLEPRLGAVVQTDGTTFTLWAPAAERVELALIAEDGSQRNLDLAHTGEFWTGFVAGVGAGQRYGYRVHGPFDPSHGLRFNPSKLLLDPYARAVDGSLDFASPLIYDSSDGDSAGHVPVSVVVGDSEPPPPICKPVHWGETVVYELHTKGFTKLHPDVPEHQRGTYAGLAHPSAIAYLQELGVTSVELLPIHQFLTEPAIAARGLPNYWGYNTLGFFAPHAEYSSSGSRGEQVAEFKAMVAAFHAAGIEVILDVVYNHTAEGGFDGPTLSFRGIDNRAYYRLGDGGTMYDVTGTGNSVDTSHPQVRRLMMDSLRYWVEEMGIDGFRFDLAVTLIRNERHEVDLVDHPFLSEVAADPVLGRVKLISEPWDVGNFGYQVGNFGTPWSEWNGKFRDSVRDVWRDASGGVQDLAYRLSGSSDLYGDDGRYPYASINFVTAHDGFTLRDLVSYHHKHNEDNHEDNRDGTDDNRSWNCGVEGETDDPSVVALRKRQMANLMSTLILSTGVPMITMGDECGRTQGGNNNAYCQDNDISWFDWTLPGQWADQLALTKKLIALRSTHPTLRQWHYFSGQPVVPGGRKDLSWIAPHGGEMTESDWHDGNLRTIGMFLAGDALRATDTAGNALTDSSFLLALNATSEVRPVVVPDASWAPAYEVVLDTSNSMVTEVEAGATVPLPPLCLVLLRAL
ncbi:glycogen debranching enzyme GlgX [Kribbella antibiotica]|uniref:Glycogen debranching enzyme GlgX n=1 Tax=Kribbella antibiotica TaxID=190195 RepID=A0A4R4Z094_9ACTN|nr:glycogen debranching enzyme GlgX [Kribbella antibiotica]